MTLFHNEDTGWWFIGLGDFKAGPYRHLVSVPDYAPEAERIARLIFSAMQADALAKRYPHKASAGE